MTSRSSNIKLLGLLVDSSDEDDSEYRFLVDGKHVKYVTVAPGALPKDIRTFTPVLLTTLPPFPPGDWNEGHISKDPVSGLPAFSRCERNELPGVLNTWHRTRIDHLELTTVRRLRQNIHVVTHPLFGDREVLVKFTEFPWQTPFFEAETTAYEWIDGQGIGPKFLGHLTEDGRAIGFVLDYVADSRPAGPEDLAACRAVLGRLHSLGIKHGDINKFNFLVREGGVVLIDFECATRCSEKSELDAENERLEHSLSDPSRRGGGCYS